MIWIILGIIVSFLVVYISTKIAGMMQVPIDEVFRLRKLENSIRIGDTALSGDKCVSSADLIRLQRPIFTVVGMGGRGPAFLPSYDIVCITQAELERRRKDRINDND